MAINLGSCRPPHGRLRLAVLGFAISSAALAAAPATAHAKDAERVLAIGGAVTEIIYALGEGDRLVARDTTSIYPPEATEKPDIGYMRALSPEGVLSVEPDLILARDDAGPVEAIEVLEAAGVPWVTVPKKYTPEGIDENIRIVADALDVPDKAEPLRRKLADDLATTAAITGSIETPRRVLFILSLIDGRVMASGAGTEASAIIELAGAENAVTDLQGYKQLSDEAVIAANPDVILMMQRSDETADHNAPDALIEAHPALGVTEAARNGAIIRMNGLYLLGFGPRTGQAALELAQAIYGDQLIQ